MGPATDGGAYAGVRRSAPYGGVGLFAAGLGGALAGAAGVWARARRMRAELVAARWAGEHDHLTGLLNRAGIRRHHDAATRAGRHQTLVLLDLNGFKQINDTYGHEAGDRLLVEVAYTLADACGPGEFAGRLGGDEFVLLLRPEARPDPAAAVAAILGRVAVPTRVGTANGAGLSVTPSASAGLAVAVHGEVWGTQLKNADIALYCAKDRKCGVAVFDYGMRHPKAPGEPAPREAPQLRLVDPVTI